MKSFLLFFNFLLFSICGFSQELLPELIITSMRYKYLSSVDNKELAQPVRLLEHQAASFDVKNSDFYEDDYDGYFISFSLPSGYVLATYDKDGKLLRTAERFKNVLLPKAVSLTLSKSYPDWAIPKDVYLVTYENEKGATKVWKVLLKQGDKRMKVRLNDKGEIISK